MAARPLLPGNLIVPLVNGVEAYPTMLEAIESATESIGLATYIFDGAGAGKLSAAKSGFRSSHSAME